MVCIYCGSGTQVTNSRHNKRINSVWRRRTCKTCAAVFTSRETADLTESIVIQDKQNHLQPFNRDKLFISIYESCKHRKDSLEDAAALTQTAVSLALSTAGSDGIIDRFMIIEKTKQILSNFDPVAATHYSAYHPVQ